MSEVETEKDFKQTEVGLIPSDWELNDLEKIVENGRISSGIFKEQSYYGKGTQIIKLGDVFSYDFFEPNYAQRLVINSKEKFDCQVNIGDIIIALASVKLEGVGKVMFVEKLDEQTVFDHNVAVIRTVNFIDNKYLFYFLKSYVIREHIRKLATQVGTTFLKSSSIRKFQILLPPTKAEQTAIATALSDADELISSLEKLIAKKQNIKQGAMQKLLQPKEGWVVKKLGEMTKVFTKQTGFDYTAYIKPSLVQERTDATIPFIQNKDFNNRWINFNTDYFIPKSVAFKFPKILLNEKSLLISISGSVGNVGLYDSKELAFIGGAVAILKFKETDLIDWIMSYLKSDNGQKKLLDNVKAGSHQNLILDDIRKIEISFPPIEEQRRITNIFYVMDAEIEKLQQQLSKYKMVKQGMMQNLLTGKIRLV